MPTIVNLPNGPFASDTTPVYTCQIVDGTGAGIPAADFLTLTLSIRDTLTGAIINNCTQDDILNTGRGAIDDEGNLTIQLEVADTSMSGVPSASRVQRSLIIDWLTATNLTGRHQANFTLTRLAGP